MKKIILIIAAIFSVSAFARDLQTQLEDCGLENSNIEKLKVCDYQIETRDTAIHGTVCTYKENGENKFIIYPIITGWMNTIDRGDLFQRQCIKVNYNSHNRASCARMISFQTRFRMNGEKLRMHYDVGLELSFKEVPVTYKHLKCKNL